MERDVADMKRTLEKLLTFIEKITTQTDQVEEELRLIRILLEKSAEREEMKDKRSEDSAKW